MSENVEASACLAAHVYVDVVSTFDDENPGAWEASISAAVPRLR
jgi:hypothetical protein